MGDARLQSCSPLLGQLRNGSRHLLGARAPFMPVSLPHRRWVGMDSYRESKPVLVDPGYKGRGGAKAILLRMDSRASKETTKKVRENEMDTIVH